MLYIASDHSGWKLKAELINWLKSKKIKVEDVGPKLLRQDDDYPDYAIPLAKLVAKGKTDLGILICRNGIGMSIIANKVSQIRAGLCSFVGQAITARAHDNCNVLALPADFITLERALKITEIFLTTDFSQEGRHIRRLDKITKLESK